MQVPQIEYFPYTGMDFRNDTDLGLPARMQWDASGNTSQRINPFVIFQMFLFMQRGSNQVSFM